MYFLHVGIELVPGVSVLVTTLHKTQVDRGRKSVGEHISAQTFICIFRMLIDAAAEVKHGPVL